MSWIFKLKCFKILVFKNLSILYYLFHLQNKSNSITLLKSYLNFKYTKYIK